MPIMQEPSGLRIDLRRLDANLTALRRLANAAKVCAVVKADAYGLGAIPIAKRLATCGVDMLAVYSLAQARHLITADLGVPILTLGIIDTITDDDPAARALQQGLLHLTIHSLDQYKSLTQTAEHGRAVLPIHPHLDTGMSRGGLSESQCISLITDAQQNPYVRIAGLCTHMASADDDPAFTAEQFARFQRVAASCRAAMPSDARLHVANTSATLRDPQYHLDMVRVGLGLYGFGPDLMAGEPHADGDVTLQPVARWWTTVQHISKHPRGQAVGYNRTHTLTRDSTLGLIPMGYADGYSLALGNRASVDLPSHHASAPIVGKVNMDQIVIDLTDIPGAAVGDAVNLYSDDAASPCSVPRLAELANANCYEMLTRIGGRVSRQYVG